MGKALIGITPQYDHENDFIRIHSDYLTAIQSVGGIPYLLPLEINEDDIGQIINHCNGFLFPGGPDIDPFLFGEETIPEGGLVLPKRDKIEKLIFKSAYKSKKPMLGICRGLQVFNVFLGGSIYQDIKTQYKQVPAIGHYQKSANEVKSHSVNIVPGSLLDKILNKQTIQVNSFHHQAIKNLAPSLRPAATSPDSLIEAAYCPDHPFLLGIQWHPEHLYSLDDHHFKIFQAFINISVP